MSQRRKTYLAETTNLSARGLAYALIFLVSNPRIKRHVAHRLGRFAPLESQRHGQVAAALESSRTTYTVQVRRAPRRARRATRTSARRRARATRSRSPDPPDGPDPDPLELQIPRCCSASLPRARGSSPTYIKSESLKIRRIDDVIDVFVCCAC